MPLLSVEDVRKKLPQVGDKVIRKPFTGSGFGSESVKPRIGVVDYVHPAHLWYRVRYKSGLQECYKLPEIEEKEANA